MALLAACGRPPAAQDPVEPGAKDPSASGELTGYFTDTLPCADCPGILTDLWVRGDSTFILQERYLDRDSIPYGTMGQWHVVNGLITIGYTGDKPYFFRPFSGGLELVDESGASDESSLDYTLERLAGESDGYVPRMRLKGTFIYMADAQSFQPCGSRYAWPCAGGMDMSEEEGEPLNGFSNVHLQRAYLKAVKQGGRPWVVEAICSMSMGPAMEGDGTDEYIWIEREPKSIESCP